MCRSSSATFSSAPTRRSPLICSEPVTPGADSARSLALQAGRSARAAADRQIAYRRLRNSESEAFSSNRVRRSYGSNRSPAAFLDNAGNHRRGRRRSFAPFRPAGADPHRSAAAFRSHSVAAPYSIASQHRAQIWRPGCNSTGSQQRKHCRGSLWLLTKAKNAVSSGSASRSAEIVLVGGHGSRVPSVSC
jgi:hypothetical protein